MDSAHAVKSQLKKSSKKLFFRSAPSKPVPLKQAVKKPKPILPDSKRPALKPNPKPKEKKTSFILAPVKKEVQTKGKVFQTHKDINEVASETKNASILSASETNKVAAERHHQVEVLGEQESKAFDKVEFKKKIKKTIQESIESKNDAENIKENGVDQKFTQDIDENINEEKTKAGGQIETASNLTPIAPPDEVTTLEPGKIKPPPFSLPSATNPQHRLAPASKSKEETNFQKDGDEVDNKMADNNVSDEQLAKSNEPRFEAAHASKDNAQKETAKLSEKYRQDEEKTIKKTQQLGVKNLNASYQDMLTTQTGKNNENLKKQTEKQQQELKIRAKVAKDLNAIYLRTDLKVKFYFRLIDIYIEKTFAEKTAKCSDDFQAEVQDLFEKNPGWFGRNLLGREAKSDIQIFEIAKTHFLENMEIPMNALATYIGEQLENAMLAVKKGKEDNETYWDLQSKDTKKIAGDLFTDSQKKFEELELSVKDKEESVVEKVQEKYEEALDGLKERFEAGKEAAKSWWERALDAIGAVIDTIIELKNSIERIAAKAASYAQRIIDAPIEFFQNLGEGVGQGFRNFSNNIVNHLISSAIEWLTGSMSEAGLELPKEFNVEGILHLALQILGITMEKVKKIVIKAIGKKRFEFLEKGVESGLAAGNKILNIFRILNEKGLAGLWEFIKEEFMDFKEMFINTVIDFIKEAITNEAIKILLSMLSPVSGFIKAAQMIIKFIITLFQNAGRILQIIDGIVDSFGFILDKNFSQAAAFVEKTLARFLTLAISFLAAVLGLDGIPKKISKFLKTKVHPKVDKALKAIGAKLEVAVKKVGLDKIIDKSMVAVQKGKDWVNKQKKAAVEKGKEYLDKFLEILGLKKPFKLGKERHTLLFEIHGDKPVFGVKSSFKEYDQWIKSITKWDTPATYKAKFGENSPQKDAEAGGDKIDKDLKKYPDANHIADRKKWADDHVIMLNHLADIIEHHALYDETDDLENIPSSVTFGSTNDHGYGTDVKANQLSNNYVHGQDTGEWSDDGSLTASYSLVKRHKDAHFVRGHLLNGNLGGRVQNFNLTPLTKKGNSDHKNLFEKFAKKLVTGKENKRDTATKKTAINFHVKVDYSAVPNIKDLSGHPDGPRIVNEINTPGVVPVKLDCTMQELVYDKATKKLTPTGKLISEPVFNPIPDLQTVKP